MYSESELAGAVEAGALTPEAATAFRNYVAASRATPAVDEEHFRLLSGFNDIFVAIAAALILLAVGELGGALIRGVLDARIGSRADGANMIGGGIAVAGTSWMLAEYFTARRRLALPSILLLLGFVGGAGATIAGVFVYNIPWIERVLPDGADRDRVAAVAAMLAGGLTAVAAWVHWRRFMVPITVAAGALAVVGVAIGLLLSVVPAAKDWVNPLLLVGGIGTFLAAMRWDMTDLERRTRRSDVAFWLHLAAAPLIAHPVFHMLGVFDGEISAPMAALVFALYLFFAFVALAVDRRALLVSSLAYVLWAMYSLFHQSGSMELSAAFTGLVIGSALLSLSAFWHPMRRAAVGLLGDLARRLPPTQQGALA
ncbi:hypothetical protein [Sphingomonas azotifigens]|uniref:hypothetical protein n=1 Tax=Sphingomonas azotifigens TaxID=330920 RepID=UPI0009FE0E9B|nr:hypothetical protein [Sphingomonas azotifigens]